MKKIIIGVFVFALLASSSAFAAERNVRISKKSINIASSTPDVKMRNASSTKDVDETCVSAAVGEREDAIATAWDVFSADVATILDARKVALTEAWKLEDAKARKMAVKKAWETAKKDKKSAASEYKAEKKATWAEFKTAAKKCGAGVGSEAAGESEAGEKVEL